jgi:hypothetical protein
MSDFKSTVDKLRQSFPRLSQKKALELAAKSFAREGGVGLGDVKVRLPRGFIERKVPPPFYGGTAVSEDIKATMDRVLREDRARYRQKYGGMPPKKGRPPRSEAWHRDMEVRHGPWIELRDKRHALDESKADLKTWAKFVAEASEVFSQGKITWDQFAALAAPHGTKAELQVVRKFPGNGNKKCKGGCKCGGMCKPKKPKRGKGILDKLAPNSMPAKVKAFLDKYGGERITRIRVCRKPVYSIIEKALRLVTNKLPYDKMYHLYMIISLSDGSHHQMDRIERNQVLQISPYQPSDEQESKDLPVDGQQVKGSACISLPSPPPVTFREAMARFVKEAQARAPDWGPWRYSATKNNCQDFVLSFLKGLGLLTPAVQTFVKQPVEGLIPSLAEKAGQVVTDLAGAATHALGGKQLEILA